MNKKINDLKYEKLLFVDIETVRGVENFDENHPFYDVWAWKWRDKETNELPESQVAIKKYNDSAALYPEWGLIACISVGFIHNEELHVTSFVGDEEDILQSYVDLMKKQARMAVGHNVISFDHPYIRKRWFINGMGEYLSDKQGNDVYMKPWLLDDSIFDTMVAWKGSGYMNTSLDELAMIFGIPSSKTKMHGNEVSDYFYAGRIDEIKTYCEQDVTVVANIVRTWKGDSILEPIVRETPIKAPTTPVLERIYVNKAISDKDKEDLRKLILIKKPSEEEIGIVTDLLTNLYIQSKMFEADSKDVVAQKTEEVNQLIKELWQK